MLESERLPAGYQEVEWIKNNSTSSGLDTGMKMSITDYSVEAKFKQDEVKLGIVLGTLNANAGALWYYSYYASNHNEFYFYAEYINGWKVAKMLWQPLDTDIHTVKFEGHPTGCDISWDNGNTVTGTYTNPQQYSTDNLFVFGRSAVHNLYFGRIYYVKLWNTETGAMLFNYVPCVRKSDDTPGFYDLVSGTFKTITNAKTKWEAGPIPGGEIPYGYKEVEWLECWNGEQYIDTGYTTLLDGDRVALWEGKTGFSSNYTGRSFVAAFNNSAYDHYCEFYNSHFGIVSHYIPTISEANTLYDVSAKWVGGRYIEYTQIINGSKEVISYNRTMDVQEDTFYLFRLIGGFRGTGIRIGRNKLTVDGVLVRDYIPVVKDNVGYMYDKVQQKLYANAGTGSFVAGPDV